MWRFPETEGSWTSGMQRMARDKGGHPSQRCHEQGSLRKSLGEKNRQVGGARVNHVVKVRKPDPWMPQGGKKIKKTTFSPRSRRTCWMVVEGFRDPTSLPSTPLPSGTGLSQPCLRVCACVRLRAEVGAQGKRNNT